MFEAIGEAAAFEQRANFWAFRRLIRPDMERGWWVARLAMELQWFYGQMVRGERPKLAIMAPPQHGKSWMAEDFIAWVSGKNPELKTIYASYSDALGTERNANLQRRFQSPAFRRIFPNLHIGVPGWSCNSRLIEFVGQAGSFRNTTINGLINGMELHLGVLDDYFKGRADAQSLTTRDKTWHWFADDFLSRFAEVSAMLMICTRWHVDDVLGRYLIKEPNARIVSFPAIAEQDEKHRLRGQALFPQVKSLAFLLERRKIMSKASWESEYQQNPFIVGGGVIPVDKAGTEGGDGACTCFLLMHDLGRDQVPRFVIEDVIRGRWSALEREQRLRQTAELKRASFKPRYVNFKVVVEQEPGSGGKESVEATIRNLSGFSVLPDKVTGSKEVRAEPFVAQVQGGNVGLIAGPWVKTFLEEAEPWPASKHMQGVRMRRRCDIMRPMHRGGEAASWPWPGLRRWRAPKP
jgi:predicted phage terminase large subunit-like protein